jgi:glycine/D-amino acid oxidase-like deaminating enzyme
VRLSDGSFIHADRFVFACGPWLPKVFPGLLGRRMQITRQEVFFIGTPAGSNEFAPPRMPVWIEAASSGVFYGMPVIEQRGFKIASDQRGAAMDPDTQDRMPTATLREAALRYVARRFPHLAGQPIVESRVCQYENSPDGNLWIDRHPQHGNVWILGGGSGHAFKHGPVIGAYAADRVADREHAIHPLLRFDREHGAEPSTLK